VTIAGLHLVNKLGWVSYPGIVRRLPVRKRPQSGSAVRNGWDGEDWRGGGYAREENTHFGPMRHNTQRTISRYKLNQNHRNKG
jgi:hypothetical protein